MTQDLGQWNTKRFKMSKTGFKKGSKIWLHKGKERKLMPQVTISDRVLIQLALVTGWKLGSGPKGKITRPQQVSIRNPVTNEQKWIPKEGSKEYLLLNKDFVFGFGNSYNNGRKNPNYASSRSGYHFKAPREWMRNSTRMYLPSDPGLKGEYVIPSEINHYLSLGWVTGIRLSNEKVICEKCKKSLTQKQLNGFHKDSPYCRRQEKKLLMDKMFNSQTGFTSKTGYSKSLAVLSHPLYHRYKELLESLKS